MSGWIKILTRGAGRNGSFEAKQGFGFSTRTLHSLVRDEGVAGSNPIADFAARRKRALCSWTGAAQLVQKAVLVAAVRGVSYFVGVASAVRRHVHVYASLVCSPNGSS